MAAGEAENAERRDRESDFEKNRTGRDSSKRLPRTLAEYIAEEEAE